MDAKPWRPKGLPAVANCRRCRWDPPIESAPNEIVMLPPEQLSNYKAWHMRVSVEVLGKDGEIVEKHVFDRDYPYLIFGRDPANVHVFCGHDSVSGQHAVFFFAWDTSRSEVFCYLRNLESTHGVRVNDMLMPATGCDVVDPEMDIQFGRAPVFFKLKYTGGRGKFR